MEILLKILKFIKKWWKVILIAILGILLALFIHKFIKAQDEYLTSKTNEKALMQELVDSEKQVREMTMSMNTLQLFSDSITTKLLNAQKELGIKDKNIQGLQYMLSHFSKKDTMYLTQYDTIFKDPNFKIDTVFGDTTWLNVHLMMEYPNTICTDINAKSEKEVIISKKRETIDPPKKFFLCRWFQKKHDVIIVDIHEENPYITSAKNRFIKVE